MIFVFEYIFVEIIVEWMGDWELMIFIEIILFFFLFILFIVVICGYY